jgi:hypothetical protein
MAQRFKACIKDPQGTTVDVHFEVRGRPFQAGCSRVGELTVHGFPC